MGETSQDVLRSIADRLTNGPTPVGALPELDSSELESEMAELSRQKSENGELWGDQGYELDATPIARAPNGGTNWPLVTSSRLSDITPTSYRSGPFSEPDDLQADRDNALHNATRETNTFNQKWQQAYSILTRQAPPPQEQDRF